MKLALEAFRGAKDRVEFTFRRNSDLTIIYGENGSGKTTVADALEFLFHKNPGSLEDRSLDGKSKFQALVNTQRKAKDLYVSWDENNERLEVRLVSSKPLVTGDLSSTSLRTLRRDVITRLIDATPAQRFARIQDFVSVPALEREEAQLAEFIKSQKETRGRQELLAQRLDEELNALYGEARQGAADFPSIEEWTTGILTEHEETRNENIQMLADLQQEINRLRSDFKPMAEALDAAATGKTKLESEEQELRRLVSVNAGGLAGALALLTEAKTFLATNQDGACPVCDTPQDPQALREKVDAKLETLQAISEQSRKAEAARRALETARTVLKTQQTNFYTTIERLRQIHEAAVDSEQWQVPNLVESLDTPLEANDLTPEWFASLKGEAAQLSPLVTWLGEELESLRRAQTIRATIERITREYQDARSEFRSLSALIKKAEAIRELLRSERTRYANETLETISEDFARLYSSIHPGEAIEKIRLYLHPDRKGSAMFDGELFGKEQASPVAYLSDSHLDTLGLCLFMALEKLSNPSETVLFLDDAIASVDEAHMARLYEAIVSESRHFKHVIITSHYQPLRFKFKWGQLTKQNVDLLELGRWSLDEGISWQRGCANEIELLKRRLQENDDPSGIAQKSGIILECIFDFLTGIYRCKLPRNPGPEQRWTLGDYKSGLEGNKRKLLNALKCDHLADSENVIETVVIRPILERIFSQLEVRNALGAHYKEIAGQFNGLTEAVELGAATMELVEALCDEDHQLPESDKNGTCWTNRGTRTTRRLHPLIQPN